MKLYLGIVQGFFPWLYENEIKRCMHKKKSGILFSYWQFRKCIQRIKAIGLHDYFSFDGPIMIDSGAYSAHHSGIAISLENYTDFLKNIGVYDSDIIVNLDVIGNQYRSFSNWSTLMQSIDHPILPVVHFPKINTIDYSVSNIGLGGMVSSLKINEKGSVFDVAAWLAKFRSITDQKFHGFGLGSPFHQLAFKNNLESIDWIGWRRNAAIGDCYTPEGSRSVPSARKSSRTRKWFTVELFDKYKPAFLENFAQLQQPGSRGWINRALWNVWIFLTAQNYCLKIEQVSYVRSIKKRMKKIVSQDHIRSLNYYFN
ncbi:hypothetical protein CEE45_07860 [Candidatus Heimdallarchaeota archaeon B3_Heim]|nr:MAG: hypothetical protein CEE45_07860 [Candidatus Heimdallarchaeota archaeon B3_Heim]